MSERNDVSAPLRTFPADAGRAPATRRRSAEFPPDHRAAPDPGSAGVPGRLTASAGPGPPGLPRTSRASTTSTASCRRTPTATSAPTTTSRWSTPTSPSGTRHGNAAVRPRRQQHPVARARGAVRGAERRRPDRALRPPGRSLDAQPVRARPPPRRTATVRSSSASRSRRPATRRGRTTAMRSCTTTTSSTTTRTSASGRTRTTCPSTSSPARPGAGAVAFEREQMLQGLPARQVHLQPALR